MNNHLNPTVKLESIAQFRQFVREFAFISTQYLNAVFAEIKSFDDLEVYLKRKGLQNEKAEVGKGNKLYSIISFNLNMVVITCKREIGRVVKSELIGCHGKRNFYVQSLTYITIVTESHYEQFCKDNAKIIEELNVCSLKEFIACLKNNLAYSHNLSEMQTSFGKYETIEEYFGEIGNIRFAVSTKEGKDIVCLSVKESH